MTAVCTILHHVLTCFVGARSQLVRTIFSHVSHRLLYGIRPSVCLQLPLELGVTIYEVVLTGSEVHFDRYVGRPKRWYDLCETSRSTPQYNLIYQWPVLLTCKTCHHEPVIVYY